MEYTISGIQQVGIGVADLSKAWAWYRRAFGMDVAVFQDEADAPLMTAYTGGEVQRRNAVLALNLRGGAGFEIWQYLSRTPQPATFTPGFGDLGIIAVSMRSADVTAANRHLTAVGADVVGPPRPDPGGRHTTWVHDPYGNLFQVAPALDWFGTPGPFGGGAGVVIGTSDAVAARRVYSEVLGYDFLIYDETGVFDDLSGLPGGERTLRRMLLTHSKPRSGPFSELLGSTTVELVEPVGGRSRRIYDDRFWGDLGFIHVCFDVRGMDRLSGRASSVSHPFTVDSANTFDMGDAGGRFGYLEDGDGTLIELVETHKVPLVQKLGLALNLRRRRPDKALPRWMVRMLALMRVKD